MKSRHTKLKSLGIAFISLFLIAVVLSWLVFLPNYFVSVSAQTHGVFVDGDLIDGNYVLLSREPNTISDEHIGLFYVSVFANGTHISISSKTDNGELGGVWMANGMLSNPEPTAYGTIADPNLAVNVLISDDIVTLVVFDPCHEAWGAPNYFWTEKIVVVGRILNMVNFLNGEEMEIDILLTTGNGSSLIGQLLTHGEIDFGNGLILDASIRVMFNENYHIVVSQFINFEPVGISNIDESIVFSRSISGEIENGKVQLKDDYLFGLLNGLGYVGPQFGEEVSLNISMDNDDNLRVVTYFEYGGTSANHEYLFKKTPLDNEIVNPPYEPPVEPPIDFPIKIVDGYWHINGENTGVRAQGEQGERGERGEKGETGERGEKGEAGVDGLDGIDGIDGRDGIDGEKGEQGERGADGIDGLDGKDGRDGIDGVDGKDGIDGRDGIDGEKGEQGERGLQGEKGEDGEDGKDGEDGEKGERGEQGPIGPIGPQGPTGMQGPQGPTGQQGPQGIQGPAGAMPTYARFLVGETEVANGLLDSTSPPPAPTSPDGRAFSAWALQSETSNNGHNMLTFVATWEAINAPSIGTFDNWIIWLAVAIAVIFLTVLVIIFAAKKNSTKKQLAHLLGLRNNAKQKVNKPANELMNIAREMKDAQNDPLKQAQVVSKMGEFQKDLGDAKQAVDSYLFEKQNALDNWK